MTGDARFRLPWNRRRGPAAAVRHVRPQAHRHITSVRLGPDAVRAAREAVAERVTKAGVAPRSAFADAVRLVVGELVTNVPRHAAHSTVADVGVAVAAGQLVVGVADAEPRLPELTA